uniref:Uncharacterized protein n=1 Tax=Nelumbo nucifera TaxID=4432 RepID=A0A822YMJ0_NELNU|nr:TPA_asm: hypothetical protein HUJ06_012144 [Nelumbo nucifera]
MGLNHTLRFTIWIFPKYWRMNLEDAYADVCFREFGDRVSYWTTINEPNIMVIASYDTGLFPPQQCSFPGGVFNCSVGNSSVEPYTAMQHIMLAHASAAAWYRQKYQAKQNGWIGLNMYGFWCRPMTNSIADAIASQRAIDVVNGWVLDPLVFGDYPVTMRKRVGTRLPSFTKSQSQLVKGSSDFIGLNHYFTIYIQDDSNKSTIGPPDFNLDMAVKFSDSPTFNPDGLQELLQYFKNYYGNLSVYVQENGYGAPGNETLNDTARIDYIKGFMESVLNAISTRGYFVWSFLDVFEVLSGYQTRYGLVHVDFQDKEFRRRPKLSAQWYSNFLKNRSMEIGRMRAKSYSSE